MMVSFTRTLKNGVVHLQMTNENHKKVDLGELIEECPICGENVITLYMVRVYGHSQDRDGYFIWCSNCDRFTQLNWYHGHILEIAILAELEGLACLIGHKSMRGVRRSEKNV